MYHVTSQNAILYICLRVGALLINKFRCVGRMHTAAVGVADLMGEPGGLRIALK